jgi:hypothetical protein
MADTVGGTREAEAAFYQTKIYGMILALGAYAIGTWLARGGEGGSHVSS